MRRVVAVSLAVGLFLWITSAALAQGYGGYEYGQPPQAAGGKAEVQLRTGIDHAKNASGSGTMATAVEHLGHVLNCIEGTKGKNFNATWGHVCQGQGDGILADIKSAKGAAAVTLVLAAADELATDGVKAKELAAVQNAARGTGALLQIVLDGIK